MNRRNFFKTVTGFVAGVFAACMPKAKADVIVFPTEEKARDFSDKRLRPKLRGFDAHFVLGDDFDEADLMATKETPWDRLGCKDCFRGCGQWDICMATLRKRVDKMNHPAYIIDKNGFVSILID